MTSPAIVSAEPASLVRARWLLKRGFSVIPLDHPDAPVRDPKKAGKIPVIKWKQYQEAPPDDATLVQWFADGPPRNVGIVAGTVSDVVVVDVDSAEALAWATSHLPPTPMRTKTATGEHWFYRHPGVKVPNKAKIHTADGRLALDIRADGGYVVSPGAQHVSGIRYEPLGDWRTPLDTLPTFDVTWIAHAPPGALPAPPVPPASRRVPRDDHEAVRARVAAYLEQAPPAIEGSSGDTHTFELCCRVVRGFDLSDADALDLLVSWNARCVPPWSVADLEEKIRSAR
ncbi:MAG TPA: bifunctional DNA primase/polymerase, partial [Vicinamibacterales bacterium]|nr:bifunctional DNA primase/polymerase [Vicinamibacterales bacterium]